MHASSISLRGVFTGCLDFRVIDAYMAIFPAVCTVPRRRPYDFLILSDYLGFHSGIEKICSLLNIRVDDGEGSVSLGWARSD